MNSLWYNIDDGCKPLELRSMSGCNIRIENPEQEHDHEHERTHPPLPMVLPGDKQNYQCLCKNNFAYKKVYYKNLPMA